MTTTNKRRLGILLAVSFLLCIPLVAMQFTSEVKWNAFDFIVMGGLLLCTGLLGELIFRKIQKIENRIALGTALLVALVLIWLELAVGIFGTPFAGS